MPKSTFYRLPDEKRSRIMEAGKKEFMENTFTDASINSIIKSADIPRGSFYQYFDGKEDLFEYLIHEHLNEMFLMLIEDLKKHGGDLFACIEYYIEMIGSTKCPDKKTQIRMLFADSHTFEIIWKSVMGKDCENEISKNIRDNIDCSKLDIADDAELMQLLDILGIVIRDTTCRFVMGDDRYSEKDIKKMLRDKMATLKRHYSR